MASSKELACKNLEKAHTPEAIAKRVQSTMANKALKSQVYDELKAMLLKGKNGGTYYAEFMKKFLDIAKKDPNSKAGQIVASTIFQQEMLSMLDEEHDKEMAKNRKFLKFSLLESFFQEQVDVIRETNHSKRIIACCSRRAGKTDLASGAICCAAIIPDSRIIYINLTFTNAINQIWNNVVQRANECGLGISKSSKADGTIDFSNGSSLRIMGNSNNSEVDKLRGESKVSLVVIDEFFHQRNMQYAVDEVIGPLMVDREDSTILCIGTPPRLPHTYGEKCWNESGWRKYHWTLFNNPYIPHPAEYLDEYCANKGITLQDPFVRREYFGEIGVYDTEALVFKDRKTYNTFDENEAITDVAIGLDYGDAANNAVITVAYNKNTKKSWVIKEDMVNRVGVSEIVGLVKAHYEKAKEICNKNRLRAEDHIKIYADTSHEQITRELMTKYNLPAYNCYKYDKYYAIELLAEELRTGRMKIPHNGVLDNEMDQILYKRDDETDAVLPELDEEMGIHPDAAMALLYASRKIFFDMDYAIDYKETKPQVSDYKVSDTGTIIGIVQDESTGIVGEDSGIVG